MIYPLDSLLCHLFGFLRVMEQPDDSLGKGFWIIGLHQQAMLRRVGGLEPEVADEVPGVSTKTSLYLTSLLLISPVGEVRHSDFSSLNLSGATR